MRFRGNGLQHPRHARRVCRRVSQAHRLSLRNRFLSRPWLALKFVGASTQLAAQAVCRLTWEAQPRALHVASGQPPAQHRA